MYGRFSLSPDGNMIAVPIAEKRNDIFILNLMTGASTKISKSGYNWQPLWNSSGNKIVFHNSDVGQKTGYIKMANSDGTGKEVIVYSSDKEMMTESWSKIGNKLSICEINQNFLLLSNIKNEEHNDKTSIGWSRNSPRFYLLLANHGALQL